MAVLLDWLTTGSNYKRYTGGAGQTGDQKAKHAGEILRLIADSGIKTVRLAKDVISKIQSLESSFKAASDWLACTGAGVENEKSLRECILMRCAYFYELLPIMDRKATTRALLTNKDAQFRRQAAAGQRATTQDPPATSSVQHAPLQALVAASESTILPNLTSTAISAQESASADDDNDSVTVVSDDEETRSGSATNGESSRSRTVPLSVVCARRKKTDEPTGPHQAYISMKEKQLHEDRDFKRLKLEFREKAIALQQQELQLKRMETQANVKESQLRQEETVERTKRHRYEAEQVRLNATVTLLRERAKLLQEGVPQADIDQLLPLTTQLE